MKSCPYCGGEYPEEATACPIDQHTLVDTLEFKKTGKKSEVACLACGAANDYTFVIEPRGSFNLFAFFTGGILAVLFYNAGRRRRVRCNQCEARFYVRSPLSKISWGLFWLIISPTIIILIILLATLINNFFSHGM